MKIVILNLSSSGLFHYACCLAAALADLPDTRILFITSRFNNPTLLPRQPNIQLYTPPAPHKLHDFWQWLLNLREQRRLYQAVEKFSPGVIHLTDSHAVVVPHAWWLKKYPIVFTQHDPLVHPGDVYPWASRLIHAMQQRLARKIVVHGEYIKQQLVQHRLVNSAKITVIPHGDYSFLLRWRDLTITPVPNSILFFGRIVEYKGLDTLLDALLILQARGIPVNLMLAGAGSLKPYHSKLQHIRQKMIINDLIPEEEIITYFQRAAVVALPYREASQSGIMAIAMPAGIPIIATTVGALPEILTHEENCLLVPPGNPSALADALARVLQDAALRERLIAGGRHTVATKIAWPLIAPQYREVYRSVL